MRGVIHTLSNIRETIRGYVRRHCQWLPANRCARGDEGFTLLELLVVILILGMLVSFVAPQAMKTLASARVSVAREEITDFSSYLERFALDVGRYPTTEEGMAALTEKPPEASNWSGPYIRGSVEQKDPWGHPWIFRSPSRRAGARDYDLCSAGPSGTGTKPGDDKTICNP
jgi:general secretion pathway protein G